MLDRIRDLVRDKLTGLAQSGGGGDMGEDPLLRFLQVQFELDMSDAVAPAPPPHPPPGSLVGS